MWPRMTSPTENFIEQMGLMAQAEGGPRIAGQILGYLIVEGEPRTLGQMTEALKISKASASTNARLLEFKGSVRRVSPVGQRQDAYEALDFPNLAVIRALGDRFRAHADKMTEIGAGFPESHAGARDRVTRFAEFHRKTADFIDDWTEKLAEEADLAATDREDPR